MIVSWSIYMSSFNGPAILVLIVCSLSQLDTPLISLVPRLYSRLFNVAHWKGGGPGKQNHAPDI